MVLTTHQWTECNNLEDALQCEEGCENDVQVFQYGLIHVWSSIELRTEGKAYTEYTVLDLNVLIEKHSSWQARRKLVQSLLIIGLY